MDKHQIRIDRGVLWIDDKIFWDMSAFRPDMSRILQSDKDYEAIVRFDYETILKKDVSYPKIIYYKNIRFINIR